MVALLPLVVALAAPGAAAPSPPTTLERRACEQQLHLLAKATGIEDRASDKDIQECSDAFREISAGYRLKADQYERWLRCKAEAKSAVGGPCDKMLGEQLARTAGEEIDAMFKEDKRRETAALAALAPYRKRGLIGAGTYKEIEKASRDGKHGSLSDLFEDAVQVLEAGRVRPGTELAIYPHDPITMRGEPPPGKGERAADLAFVDARSGKRVVRFSPKNYATLLYKVGNGELANALTFVGQKPDERSIEVPYQSEEEHPAHLLLTKDAMEVASKLGKRLSPELRRIPFLIQGKASISYDRWVALVAAFHARGLDKDNADEKALARMVTLADIEKFLH